jgi:hypothetical protein
MDLRAMLGDGRWWPVRFSEIGERGLAPRSPSTILETMPLDLGANLMPESRGRRPGKSSQSSAKSDLQNKPLIKEDKEKNNQKAERKRPSLLDVWKNVWAIAGPAITLISFAYFLWPEVRIEPSANLDPSKPLATHFRITNTGHVPVYNVTFDCNLGGGPGTTSISGLRADPLVFQHVRILPAGKDIDLACATSAEGQIPNMSIVAHFEWPLIGHSDKHLAFFKIVRGRDGYFLLPDLPWYSR